MAELCTASLQKIQACNRVMIISIWGALRGRRDFICPDSHFVSRWWLSLTHSWWFDIVEYMCTVSSTMMTSVMQPTPLIDDQL